MFFKKKNKEIMFHDDIDTTFKPLNDFLSDYFGNREYFNISNDGKTEGEIEDWRNWND